MNDDTVLSLMAATAGIVFLGEGYVNNYAAWVVAKTQGKTYQQVTPTESFAPWAFGIVAATGALLFIADGSPGLAAAFAGLIAAGAFIKLGAAAGTNAKALVGIAS